MGPCHMGPTKKKKYKKYGPDMFRHRGGPGKYGVTPNIDEEIFLDVIKKSFCEASHSHSHSPTPTHSHSHLILDPGSAYPDHARGGEAPSSVIVVCRSRIQDQVAVAVAVDENALINIH